MVRPAGQVAPSRADHELANPAHIVDLVTVGILRREALVGVVVPGQNQVGVGVIQGLVKRLGRRGGRPPEL